MKIKKIISFIKEKIAIYKRKKNAKKLLNKLKHKKYYLYN